MQKLYENLSPESIRENQSKTKGKEKSPQKKIYLISYYSENSERKIQRTMDWNRENSEKVKLHRNWHQSDNRDKKIKLLEKESNQICIFN